MRVASPFHILSYVLRGAPPPVLPAPGLSKGAKSKDLAGSLLCVAPLPSLLPLLPLVPLLRSLARQLDTRSKSPYGGGDGVQIANSGEEAGSAVSEGRRTWHSQEWLRSPAITVTLGTIRKGSCASTRRRLIARAPQNKLVPSMMARNKTAPESSRTKSRTRTDPENGSGQGSSGRGGPSFLRTP